MNQGINLVNSGKGIGVAVSESPRAAFTSEHLSDSQFQGARLAGLRETHIALLKSDNHGETG